MGRGSGGIFLIFAGRRWQVVAAGPADGLALAATEANKCERKYHRFLAEDLLSMDYATRSLYPQGTWQMLNHIHARL